MQCDMCGAETSLVLAEIEGVQLQVCKKCARYGQIIKKSVDSSQEEPKKQKPAPQKKGPEKVQRIVPGYASLVRQGREKMQLKQEEFAKKVNEKASLINQIENARIVPNIAVARKLARVLQVNLIEEVSEEEMSAQSSKKGSEGKGLTVGDLINVRR